MQLRADADRIAILDRVIDMLEDSLPHNRFKLLVDKETVRQLLDRDPQEFFWGGADYKGNRYRDRPFEVRDDINGIWIQMH